MAKGGRAMNRLIAIILFTVLLSGVITACSGGGTARIVRRPVHLQRLQESKPLPEIRR